MRAFLACLATAFALPAAAQTCLVCGKVASVREVSNTRLSPGATDPAVAANTQTGGGIDGPSVGTVAQFRFGAERGQGWSFGAAGTPEMQQRLGEVYYEITVAMDNGERRTVQRRDGNRFYAGQRVALRSGEIEPM